jgi:uncharacterized protein YqfB (UPF0267 family)
MDRIINSRKELKTIIRKISPSVTYFYIFYCKLYKEMCFFYLIIYAIVLS